MAQFLPLIALAASAGGQLAQGFGAANAANYQAAVAENNATIARGNAGYTAGAGATEIEDAGLKARSESAGVRSSLAANGVDVNTGSAAGVQVSQREIGQLDTETVANRAALDVYGYQTQATSYDAQAQLDRMQASGDILSGVLGAAGSVAGNAQFTSLLSSAPGLPSNYQWMGGNSAGGDASGAEDIGFG